MCFANCSMHGGHLLRIGLSPHGVGYCSAHASFLAYDVGIRPSNLPSVLIVSDHCPMIIYNNCPIFDSFSMILWYTVMLSWGNARSGKSGRHVIDIRARIIKLQFRRQPLADITYETQYCSQASGFNFGHPGFCILFPFFTSRVLAFSACPIRRN